MVRLRSPLQPGAIVATVMVSVLLAGCGGGDNADAPKAQQPPSAAGKCPYATDDEFSAAIGAKVTSSAGAVRSDKKGCEFEYSPDSAGESGLVQIEIYDSAAAYDKRLAAQCKPSEYSVRKPVPGIGLEAYECGPDLLVKVDTNRGFVVYLQCCASKRDALEALAELIAPRIKAE